MTIKKILFTALLAIVSQTLMAQGIRISGTLTDNDGPIMMANVVERDANNRIVSAVQTDFNGNFSMQVKSTKNKLVFSYVGDKTQVVTIGNKTVFNIKLEPEGTQLQEVVVKAKRGSSGGLMISKKEISVSQQTFDLENVKGLAFTSADEALQGEIAGLDIVSNSGNLGAGTSMRLRGVTSITGDANPLIVVDDKIFDNPDENFDFANANEEQYASLLSVNVEDIASITVLKDAAATAVWGSRGSNGVLVITTKHGMRGKPRVDFSYKFTGTWQPAGYTLLNGDEYSMLMKEEFYNPGQRSDATADMQELNYNTAWPEYENWNNNTDWVKAVKQFGAMHDYNMTLSGGGEKATFRISAGYKNQTGSIIKQKFQQFTTRLVLDYNVSDRIRFSTNFALTYTNNDKNYSNLLGIAQNIAPNMSIYRQDANGNDTGEYYIMNESNPTTGGGATDIYSSNYLSPIRGLGNPVAIANLASSKEQTYRLTPDFSIKYELLGTEPDKSRLTLNGRVDFDIYASSSPTYYPASLSSARWNSSTYNAKSNSETNRMKVGGRVELVFTPHFKNEDWFATMLARYEMSTSKYNNQYTRENNLPPGVDDPTVYAWLYQDNKINPLTSGNSRSASQNLLYNGHISYKDGRYSLGFSLRADGDSKFGPKHKWALFPGVSLRYNISDEPFMTKIKGNWLSMLGLRASWGVNGKAPSSNYLFYNTYNTSAGYYGAAGNMQPAGTLDGLKIDDLRWEKTTSMNLGFNLGLLNDKIEIDFDYYHKVTKDLLMSNVAISSVTGYGALSYMNVGQMNNDGWELNVSAKKLIKIGKFSMDMSFNVAQNSNLLKEMDESVLESLNTWHTVYSSGKTGSPWGITNRGDWPLRVQLNNSLGSIYGFRYNGVYQYGYDYLENLQKENNWNESQYEAAINGMLAEGKTFPIVVRNGKVLMQDGHPRRMLFNYVNNNGSGSSTYTFQGGDAIYQDINNDGQINELDIVYLGNSLPKINGGFNFTFRYGNWSVKTRFMYRFGNKIVNLARQNLEKMYDTYNQCATVNYRWRKDGDVTVIPRAMHNASYNFQPSDRFVEDGGFVRFQNLQIAYNFPKKMIKKWGLNQLQAYASLNNLYVWTKYSGVDPEISPQGYGVAADASQTPRSKQFTLSLNIGF